MGGGMAAVLLKAGFPLAVYNRNSERAKPFEVQGARVAESPQDAAKGADIVISMVADDNASRGVWTGANGVLEDIATGTVLVECSTISPGWARELAGLAAAKDCPFLDAPVTGSKAQAASGALRFLVGGDAATIQRVEPVLKALGTEIIPLGPPGSGALLKLINNMVCGVQVASIAEAVALIEKSDLDSKIALKVLTGGAPGSPLVKGVSERMTSHDDTVHFAAQLMSKDLSYALAEGEGHGVTLETVAAARRVFERAGESGRGGKDISAVIEPLR